MTHASAKKHPNIKPTARPIRAGDLILGGFTALCLLVILRNSDAAIEYVTRGLLLCARTVIPSLFPFMVLSELIVAGGIGNTPLRLIARPVRRLLGFSEVGCRAFLLGLLCGFPIGARCAVASYARGEMTRAECERVVCVSGAPSSAFLISAVGASLWENRLFGVCLYAAVALAAILTAILLSHIFPTEEASLPEYAALRKPPLRGVSLFTHSVRSATDGILSVTAYVVFFSVLTGTLELVLAPLSLPPTVLAVIGGSLELSGGVSLCASLDCVPLAAILTAATVGWSGISVHCQTLAVTERHGISLRPYLLAKLLQSLLCAATVAFLIYVFPQLLRPQILC